MLRILLQVNVFFVNFPKQLLDLQKEIATPVVKYHTPALIM